MALKNILLQGLRFKSKASAPGHGIYCCRGTHRVSAAGWRLAVHVGAS
jgi:hypothetical protein